MEKRLRSSEQIYSDVHKFSSVKFDQDRGAVRLRHFQPLGEITVIILDANQVLELKKFLINE